MLTTPLNFAIYILSVSEKLRKTKRSAVMNANIPFILSDIDSLIASDFFKTNLKGRKGLRSSVKSDAHPLLRYVHRMIRFYGGIDMRIPTTTQFFIQDYVDNLLGQNRRDDERLTVYLLKDGVEEIYHKLDEHARELCDYFGLDKDAATKRWRKALYG